MFQRIDIFHLKRNFGLFLSVFIARRCFWELPGAQFGVLGRSWGSWASSWDASEIRWDLSAFLLGRAGVLLEGIRAPEEVPRQLGALFWAPEDA